ncbi:ATP-binding protein [Simiduia sp. 21SJ11W-1]|uniref:ATP-binding protein n=1 Tax=Simiduia sp. 21SJ11W-1 TaxID=2909669 RepID=UPI0020A0C11B|nr:ATP-binding protein [Simiduia sp. 21SJ11W-1]UTA49089.1 ATP-binding protein [Simiduia sp. 21SJ11W-1]
MRLRHQLFLLVALSLVLPWAALQYVSEMQSVLRAGQLSAMQASARAVSKLLASDGEYLALTSRYLAPVGTTPLYAHPLIAPPILDGYDDEWRHFPFDATAFSGGSSELQAEVKLGEFGNQLYAFINVRDGNVHYHNPARDAVASGDHLVLRTRNRQGRPQDYVISASAPGRAQVYRLEGARAQLEHRISVVWQERVGGYQLELQMPAADVQEGLAFTLVSQAPGAQIVRLSSSPSQRPVPPVMRQHNELNGLLAVFAETDQRWMILSPGHWLLADAGSFQGARDDYEQGERRATPYAWLWRILLARPDLPQWRDAARAGRLVFEKSETARWFYAGDSWVAQVTVPVFSGAEIAGFIVLEQSAHAQDAGTQQALWRLLVYCLLTVAVLGIGLLGYASWLSFRVRRLAHAADQAMDEHGAVASELPDAKRADELGDLSRSFSLVLTRLGDYTRYLQSLSSKLSHELRTPLAVVKSSLDNLAQELPLADAQDSLAKYHTRAQAGADRLSAILNAMSAATRLETSLSQADKEPINLAELTTELAVAYSDTFKRPIALRIQDKDLHNFQAQVAPDLIVQLLDKLIENAVDFCPPDGQIVLALAREGQHICLQVSNDGPLLPQAMQHQLFDSLVSVRNRTDNSVTHLGLGLHIVRLIVAFHEGEVSARNRADGTGVEFEVRLPVPKS